MKFNNVSSRYVRSYFTQRVSPKYARLAAMYNMRNVQPKYTMFFPLTWLYLTRAGRACTAAQPYLPRAGAVPRIQTAGQFRAAPFVGSSCELEIERRIMIWIASVEKIVWWTMSCLLWGTSHDIGYIFFTSFLFLKSEIIAVDSWTNKACCRRLPSDKLCCTSMTSPGS